MSSGYESIEELRLLLAKLQAAEQRFQTLIEQMADAMLVVNGEGIVRWVNPAAAKLFARPVKALLGEPFGFPVEVGAISEIDLFNGAHKVIGEMQVVETSWEEAKVHLVTIRDVTERQSAERMKSEFLSVISHELLTPLTAIKGALKILSMDQVDAEQRAELMSVAQRNTERLHGLVNDLLSIEKLDVRGELTIEARRIDLVEVVTASIEKLRSVAASQNIDIHYEHNVPKVQIFADRDRMMQVMENLLYNALDFSPQKGSIAVILTKRADVVRVAVTDLGPGVPLHARHRIFGRFQQADSSDTRKKGGTGIGLTIAKAIVEQHDGRIGFDSVPGSGATFWFDLPYMVQM